MTRPFRADELSSAEAPGDPAELAAAVEVARLIERTVGADGVLPTPGFSDRVMAAVATQPAPRRSHLAALSGAIRATWQTALSANRPPLVRAKALAIVLVVLVALGSIGGAVTLAAAGALNLFQAHPSSGPLITPGPQPKASPDSTETRNPDASPEPTETVGPGETPEPSETVESSETSELGGSDNPGGGGGGGGDGGSGSGSKATPRPGRTTEPTETPEPTETANPSDH